MGVYTNSTAVAEASLEEFLAEADTSSFNPFGFMVDTYRADQALFEALIEVDFAEVYNESGMLFLDEADKSAMDKAPKEGIWKRIWTTLENIGRWVANFFKGIGEKISEIATSNKKLIEKYGKYMNVKNLEGCQVKGRYVDMKELTKIGKDAVDTTAIIASLSKIKNASEDSVESVGDEIIKKCKDTEAELKGLIPAKNSGEKPIVDVVSNDIIQNMIDDINNGLKLTKQVYISAAKAAKDTVDNTKKKIKNELSKENDSKKLNTLSKVVTAITSLINTYSKVAANYVKTSISASRAFWFAAGPYAMSKVTKIPKVEGEVISDEEYQKVRGTKEAAIEMENAELMAEMSNMYVDDIFEFNF